MLFLHSQFLDLFVVVKYRNLTLAINLIDTNESVAQLEEIQLSYKSLPTKLSYLNERHTMWDDNKLWWICLTQSLQVFRNSTHSYVFLQKLVNHNNPVNYTLQTSDIQRGIYFIKQINRRGKYVIDS